MMQITAVVPLNSVLMKRSASEERERESGLLMHSSSAFSRASKAAVLTSVRNLLWAMRLL